MVVFNQIDKDIIVDWIVLGVGLNINQCVMFKCGVNYLCVFVIVLQVGVVNVELKQDDKVLDCL